VLSAHFSLEFISFNPNVQSYEQQDYWLERLKQAKSDAGSGNTRRMRERGQSLVSTTHSLISNDARRDSTVSNGLGFASNRAPQPGAKERSAERPAATRINGHASSSDESENEADELSVQVDDDNGSGSIQFADSSTIENEDEVASDLAPIAEADAGEDGGDGHTDHETPEEPDVAPAVNGRHSNAPPPPAEPSPRREMRSRVVSNGMRARSVTGTTTSFKLYGDRNAHFSVKEGQFATLDELAASVR
jgi:hypothetical protein